MTKFDTTQITWERNQVATKRWYRQKNMLYSRVRSPAELLLPCAVIQYQRHVSKWDANVPTCISSLFFSFTFTFAFFSLPYDHIILQYPYYNNQERWILQIYPITMTSWLTFSWMVCSCGSRQPRWMRCDDDDLGFPPTKSWILSNATFLWRKAPAMRLLNSFSKSIFFLLGSMCFVRVCVYVFLLFVYPFISKTRSEWIRHPLFSLFYPRGYI